eukprot:m.63721 g.63721  ORF g.63721 m.63721 type:complete len:112 (+) comp49668_c0_seq2:247-582(+)
MSSSTIAVMASAISTAARGPLLHSSTASSSGTSHISLFRLHRLLFLRRLLHLRHLRRLQRLRMTIFNGRVSISAHQRLRWSEVSACQLLLYSSLVDILSRRRLSDLSFDSF